MKKQTFYTLEFDNRKFENFNDALEAKCRYKFRCRIGSITLNRDFVNALIDNIDELENIISEYRSEMQLTELDCIEDGSLEVLK